VAVRGISTVLDVTLFLLCLSTAVVTLALAPAGGDEAVTVDDRAAVLATTTADIEYSLGAETRRAHGTVAVLLARGAVANATVDGRPLSESDEDFVRRVRETARERLGPANRTQVLARWYPYRGAPVSGTVTVGTRPPPAVDVTVATVTVPAPAPAVRDRATSVADGGFDAVAGLAGRATTRALLPAGPAALPVGGRPPATVATTARVRGLAAATGRSVSRALSRRNVSRVRAVLSQGLADRFAADMRERFGSPEAAARAIRAGTVEITLRRWAG